MAMPKTRAGGSGLGVTVVPRIALYKSLRTGSPPPGETPPGSQVHFSAPDCLGPGFFSEAVVAAVRTML